MKVTLTAIKADIGSIGGHLVPSTDVIARVEEFITKRGKDLICDHFTGHTGDDIAVLVTHERGPGDEDVHRLVWEAFKSGTEVAKSQGLYGAGQDLLKDAFSGNVRGLGPAVAELCFEERENEPFLLFTADKTEPGAYSLPLYLAFVDPMYSPGLVLSPTVGQGFTFTVMDVSYTEQDRVIEIRTPEEAYDLVALLRDNGRFVVESIRSRATGEEAVSCGTTRLRNIAGKYVGKDDPVCIVRAQHGLPAVGEVLDPFASPHIVAGWMRGSHRGPLMPVSVKQAHPTRFDGPPRVIALGFQIAEEGKLIGPVDLFDDIGFDLARQKALEIADIMRAQGPFEPHRLSAEEMEYTTLPKVEEKLEKHWKKLI